MKISSLKRKFIIFAIILIAPIATSNIISIILTKKINNNYNTMQNRMSIANDIKSNINASYSNFNQYILANSFECKMLYEEFYKSAVYDVSLLQEDSEIDSRYILRDLMNSLRSYKSAGDSTVELYENQKGIDAYYIKFQTTKDISSYCNTFVLKLIDSYLNNNDNVYRTLKEKQGFIYKVLVIYIITALLISFVYTFFFLKNILDKLNELVQTSKKVSKGDFTYFEGKRTNLYELDILSDAFSAMIRDIKRYINSIRENADLKIMFKEEEMKLLKSQNALRQSQLRVLQSQINPHFLFNTLNCINQTAIKEKAGQTETLIKSVSGILRYSLGMMNRFATLEEEIGVVKQYMFIQGTRYDDRLKFNLSINADLSQVKVPGMTLQPFVENAFIHGIEPMEEGGTINIEINEDNGFCTVLIGDTGCGMDEDTLNRIIYEDVEKEHTGHTTGMGIMSVVKRLELMYERKDIFSIESKAGYGTNIYLKIPMKELKEIC